MKKVLFLIAAAALTLSSCVKEQVGGAEGEKVRVEFGLELNKGAQTRAGEAAATSVDELWYAVFDENDELIREFAATKKSADFSQKVEVPLTLTKGQTYTIAFWAQSSGCEAYTVSEDLKVKVNYDGAANNDADRDAFYGKTEKFTVGGTFNKVVTLTRPFAQINAGVTKSDWDAAVKTDFTVAQSKATVSGVATELDVFTGELGTETTDVTYELADIPTGELKVGETVYKWLSMSYILADASTHDVTFTFKAADESKAPVVLSDGLNNVPVKRNWRTNIIGTLLTGDVAFEIRLELGFADQGDFNITDEDLAGKPEDDFYKAVQEGGVVYANEAMEEISFNGLEIQNDVVVVLNKPVGVVRLGGNNEGAVMKSAVAEKPNVTVVVAKDVPFPAFDGGYGVQRSVENYTIKADPKSSEMYNGGIQFWAGENITLDGIRFGEKGYINSVVGVNNLTVKNCTAVEGKRNGAFITVAKSEGLTLLNNTVKSTNLNDGNGLTYSQNQDVFALNSGLKGEVLIEGNTIEGSLNHHGIWIANSPEAVVTIKNNTITNTYEDAIKIDQAVNVTVVDNTLDAGINGVRFDNFNGTEATLVVTGNTISTKGTPEKGYGIYFKNKGNVATKVNATSKDNIVAEAGIADGQYFKVAETLTLSGDYNFPFATVIADGLVLSADSKTYGVSNANGLVTLSEMKLNGGQNVMLRADIDLAGVEFAGLAAFNPENKNTFDGQGFTVSNVTNTSGASDMGFIKGWTGTIKNVTIKDANFKTAGRSAILAAKPYANIDNCHIVGGSIEDSYWACGAIAGMYNSGNITNCTVNGVKVKSNGGVGGIVGVINEAAGERKIENCKVIDSEIISTRAYGDVYGDAAIAGMINISNSVVIFNNNKVEGCNIDNVYGYVVAGTTVYVDGLPDGLTYDDETATYGVSNAKALEWVSNQVEAGDNFDNQTIVIKENIVLPEDIEWNPIGTGDTPFAGTIDGNNKEISGIDVSSGSEYAGLVGKLDYGAVIKDVVLKDINITSDTNMAGAIAGYNQGIIINCHVDGGTITSNQSNVGGITGINAGTGGAVIAGCSVRNLTIIGKKGVSMLGGAIAATNTTGGIIIGCCAENVVLKGFNNDAGLVSLNSAGYGRKIGKIIASYSVGCMSEENALDGTQNLYATNYSGHYGDAVVNASFYKQNGKFTQVEAQGTTVTENEVNEWSAVQAAMNTAITSWNLNNSNLCPLQWGDTEGSLVKIQ